MSYLIYRLDKQIPMFRTVSGYAWSQSPSDGQRLSLDQAITIKKILFRKGILVNITIIEDICDHIPNQPR